MTNPARSVARQYNTNQLPSGLDDEVIDVEAVNSPRQNARDIADGLGAVVILLFWLVAPLGFIWFVVELWLYAIGVR